MVEFTCFDYMYVVASLFHDISKQVSINIIKGFLKVHKGYMCLSVEYLLVYNLLYNNYVIYFLFTFAKIDLYVTCHVFEYVPVLHSVYTIVKTYSSIVLFYYTIILND